MKTIPYLACASACLLTALAVNISETGAQMIERESAKKIDGSDLLWYDIRDLGVEGRGWEKTKTFYDRLPARAEGLVRAPVWNLSSHSAGMSVRFVTDARQISARWTLRGSNLSMFHMAATGVSGLDLYVRHEGKWRWLGIGRPQDPEKGSHGRTFRKSLISGLPAGKREYRIYLPLYNGVTEVLIGLPESNSLEKAPPYPEGHEKPIVFYGTSITHGACASRPGMCYTAMLGRRLDRPVINLGFSGNGKLDPEMGDLLAELDASLYFIDCLPNTTSPLVGERTEPLVRKIREKRPTTPIILVEDRTYGDAYLVPSKQARHRKARKELRQAFENLKKAGVPELYYIPARGQLGQDGDGTVDSSHPNDLGFYRMTNFFEKTIRKALKE